MLSEAVRRSWKEFETSIFVGDWRKGARDFVFQYLKSHLIHVFLVWYCNLTCAKWPQVQNVFDLTSSESNP